VQIDEALERQGPLLHDLEDGAVLFHEFGRHPGEEHPVRLGEPAGYLKQAALQRLKF
jgi:hypothetical protein